MNDVEVFKFAVYRWLIPIVSLGMIVFTVFAIADSSAKDLSEHWFIFQVLLPLFAFSNMLTFLPLRDVVISKKGIGRSFLGIRGRFVPWETITSVDCSPLSWPSGKAKFYFLKCGDQRRFGGVTVWSAIDDIERLVALMEIEITQRKIPILKRNVLGTGMDEMDQLPSPVTGGDAWR
jgi:hypothetical protein